jgi:hypothetical protein
MASPYEDLAGSVNKIAGTNIYSGEEPSTISTRKRLSSAQSGIGMGDLLRSKKYRDMMRNFEREQFREQNEAGPLDFLSLIPGVGGFIKGIEGRHNMGNEKKMDIFQILGL